MNRQITISRHTNRPGQEWTAKLSNGKGGGVGYYGSTPGAALDKLAANHNIEGIDILTNDAELKRVATQIIGHGRYQKAGYASK